MSASNPRSPTLARPLRPWRGAPLVLALALSVGLSGCATLPNGKPDPRDRFERFNRSVYKFNTAIDHAVLRPVARGYVKVTPQPVRTSVSNALGNFFYPTTIINDFLQAKFDDFGTDLARLVVNTTVGIGGLFDPASRMGLDRHKQDFGLTLGHWGMHSGPYLMLPLLGPSTIRDAFGFGVDAYAGYYTTTKPILQENSYSTYSIDAVRVVDTRVGLLDTDAILARTYDPYAFIRNAYLQQRQYQITGEVQIEDDSQDDSGASGGAPPPK